MSYSIEPLERRSLLSRELDPTFGTAGVVDTDFATQTSDKFTAVAIGPNGTTYAAGRLDAYTLVVARYTATGALDPTFGNGDGTDHDGVAKLSYASLVPTEFKGNVALAVTADGRTYVGATLTVAGQDRLYVQALAADGSPNAAFNSNPAGRWAGTLGGDRAATLGGLALDGNTLYAAGADGRSLAAVRFTAAGTTDASFGNGGVARVDLGNTLVSGLSAVAVQVTHATGTPALMIAGNATRAAGNLPIAVVGELNAADGSPRAGFQTTFVSVVWYGGFDFTASHAVVDSRGAVVLAGICSDSGAIARVLPTGGVDRAFSSYGSFIGGANAYLPDPNGGLASTEYATITSLATLRDGEIVFTVQRQSTSPLTNREYVFALTRQGRFNEHFSPEREASGDLRSSIGVFVTPLTGRFAAAAADSSGRVTFVGANTPGGVAPDARVMRLSVQTPQPLVATIRGTIYFDADADGVCDPTEVNFLPSNSTRGKYRIYDDRNNNGLQDAGEPSDVVDDFDGRYVWEVDSGVPVRLRVAATPGYRMTPADGVVLTPDADHPATDVDLGLVSVSSLPTGTASIRGTVYHDINGNGAFDPAESAIIGRQVTISLSGKSYPQPGELITAVRDDGTFVFENLPAGTYTVRTVDGELPPTSPAGGTMTVTVADGEQRTGVLFGQADYQRGTANGRVFIDADKNGIFGAGDAPLGGQVFVDDNYNGVLDSHDLFSATVDPATGLYSLPLPALGLTYRVQFARGNGYAATTVSYYDVTPTNNQTVAGRDFGVAPVGASAGGVVFRDANQNGKQDAGEGGLAGEVVYLDVDNDKVLDANERRTTTDAGGAFAFDGLADTGAATRLRVVVRSGVTQTTPANGFGFQLTSTPGATNAGKLFGLYTPVASSRTLGSISGFAFDDRNRNGKFDGGDAPAGGKTIWLDLDDDGKLDANEPTYRTGSDGRFTFTNLAARKYHVRRQVPAGYVESTPAGYVTLTAGAAIGGVMIGSKAR